MGTDTNKIKLILPNKDYTYICRDKGVTYALSFDIPTIKVRDLKQDLIGKKGTIYLLDILLTSQEIRIIEHLMETSPHCFFLAIIADPHSWTFKSTNIYSHIISIHKKNNGGILSVYSPAAKFKTVIERHSLHKHIIVHYPYFRDEEVKLNFDLFSSRKHKIIFSGTFHRKDLYSYRIKFLRQVDKKYYDKLNHCGYRQNVHNIVGQKYINRLANYKFMLVTPSMLKLELLKYSECAAAGCVPVGLPPSTLESGYFLDVGVTDIDKTISDIMKMSDVDLYPKALEYRTYMSRVRCADALKKHIMIESQSIFNKEV